MKRKEKLLALLKEGEELLRERKYSEAKEVLQKGLGLPSLSDWQRRIILSFLGTVYLEEGHQKEEPERLKEAISYFNQCLNYLEKFKKPILKPALREFTALCLFNRGQCFFILGDYQKAIEDFSKSFQLQPENPKAKMKEAQSYLKLGRWEKGEEILEKLAKKPIEDSRLELEILTSLGEAKFRQDKIEASEAIFQEAEKKVRKTGEELRYFLPKILYYKGSISFFREEYRDALEFAFEGVNEELRKSGYKKEDLERISKENIPRRFWDPLGLLLSLLGSIYSEMEEIEKALRYFQLAQKFRFRAEIEKEISELKKKKIEIKMLPFGPSPKELMPAPLLKVLPSISEAAIIADLEKEEKFRKISRALKGIFESKFDLIETAKKNVKEIERLKREIEETEDKKRKRILEREIEDVKSSLIFQLVLKNLKKKEEILSLNPEEIYQYFQEIQKE